MEKIFNPKELLTMAIQIEKNGFTYYCRMAEGTKNPDVKKIFEQLAKAEKQHITDFKLIEESLAPDEFQIPDDYLTPDIDQYLCSLSDGEVFSNLTDVAEVAGKIQSDRQAILHAISFEKDSIIFFHEIHDLLSVEAPNRKAVGELIPQEKIHMAGLYTLLSGTNSGE